MKPKLNVVFRKWANGDVIALFCGSSDICNAGKVESYMHIGQHAEASRDLGRNLNLAEPHEYAPLLREIQGIYNDAEVVPVKRLYTKPRRGDIFYA